MSFKPRIFERPDEETSKDAPLGTSAVSLDATAARIEREDFILEGLDLPVELSALAEQLGDDAAFLSTKYPARDPFAPPADRSVAVVAADGRGSRLAAAAAAVLLVGYGIWASATWRESAVKLHNAVEQVASNTENANSDSPRGPHEVDANASLVATRIVAAEPASHLPRGSSQSIDDKVFDLDNGPESNKSLLRGLSGPQQEAVLDLLEQGELGQASLSI